MAHLVDEVGDVFEVLSSGTYRELDERSPKGEVRPASDIEVAAFIVRRADAWELITKSLPIARAALIKVGLADEHFLSDIGVPALARAWRSYDPKRGPWLHFASKLVYQAGVRERKNLSQLVPLESAEVLVNMKVNGEQTCDVDYILERLTDNEKLILFLRYWGDATLPEIADILGFCKSGAWLRAKRALERAREVVNDEERRSNI